jgi:hypothetical protein
MAVRQEFTPCNPSTRVNHDRMQFQKMLSDIALQVFAGLRIFGVTEGSGIGTIGDAAHHDLNYRC